MDDKKIRSSISRQTSTQRGDTVCDVNDVFAEGQRVGWWQSHKSEIAVGIVVFLICSVGSLLGKILWVVIDSATFNLWKVLVDLVYVYAAGVTGNTIPRLIFSMMLGGMLGTAAGMIVIAIRHLSHKKNAVPQRKRPGVGEQAKGMLKLCIVNFVLMVVVSLVLMSYVIYPVVLRDRFDLDMDRIATFVDAQTICQLRSDWVKMKGKRDYSSIRVWIAVFEKDHLKKINDMETR